ncbi:hypothetical protein QUA83_01550 [Microcoleus sp. K1-B1]|uniref:hypothetical protein n=1 Tax=Microcoleus sp. K1-B6 TaxID=2818787 RepID=UPI002FD849B2
MKCTDIAPFILRGDGLFPKCDATFSVGIYDDLSKLDRPFFPKCDRPIISAWQPLSNSTERSV